MKIQHTLDSLLMLGFVMAPTVQADTSVAVPIEGNFLPGYLDGSACECNRNGTWHNAQAAQAHLRGKYKYLLARYKVTLLRNSSNKLPPHATLPAGRMKCAAKARQ
jgi:Family of unknown function (DUF5329)